MPRNTILRALHLKRQIANRQARVGCAWISLRRFRRPWPRTAAHPRRGATATLKHSVPSENDTWWYRHQFELPPEAGEAERYDLLFEGVSLFATVWLNGSPVGFIRNAHHPHRFDISAHVNREGRNVLAVECRLDLERMKQTVRRDVSKDAEEIRPYMRLAQMCFGWDFAPRLPLIGLWRPVHLLCHREVSIDDLYVRTDAIEQGVAEITIEARMRTLCALKEPAKLHLGIHESPDAPALWRQSVELCGDAPILVQARLDPVRPWYPQPIGEPFRYHLDARIESGGTEIDRHTTLFGVRTVELKQDEQFTFCINGTDVFAKGANWVPSNSMSLESSPEHYRHLLRLARDAHFNMLRIWGGGIYEPETFYDLCDEFGIMVWQDFMYACAMYPDDDPAFMESASLEARHIVQRLRRHPSVVLWCGNNECQEAWVLGDWPDRARRHLGERLYDQVLPQTVRDLSPDVPYWPGSPYGGPTTRSREIGDFHDWYSLPNWRTYDANAPRFSSEYGFRSVPQRETVEAMISREFLWDRNGPQHNAWDFHHGRCGWLREILPEFGNPKTLDEYIMLTQEAQATLMRYAVEVYRRRMYATSGSLIWQYNEPWPAVTFSLVDFFGRPKAAYYWVRHACQPVMGMFYQPAEGPLAFWGVNDLAVPYECHVRLRRYDHKGEALGECVFDGRLMPNAATRLLEVPGELHLEEPGP